MDLNLHDLNSYYRVEIQSKQSGRWQTRQCWQYEKDAYKAAWQLRNQGKLVRIVKREVVETVVYEG